jgi:FAD synthase
MRTFDWQTLINGGLPAETAMTIGVFDGVHRGHQALIERILRPGQEPTVLTFLRSPKWVLRPEACKGDILSLPQKLAVFERMGVRQTILIDFSGDFSRLKGREFLGCLINQGKLRYLALGSDFRCGYRLDTDAALIRELTNAQGITTEVIPPILSGGQPVSSSRIRAAVLAGDLAGAEALLGRKVELDLAGCAARQAEDFLVFDLASAGRLLPPAGRYSALVYGASGKSAATELLIGKGTLCLPLDVDAPRRVELLGLRELM